MDRFLNGPDRLSAHCRGMAVVALFGVVASAVTGCSLRELDDLAAGASSGPPTWVDASVPPNGDATGPPEPPEPPELPVDAGAGGGGPAEPDIEVPPTVPDDTEPAQPAAPPEGSADAAVVCSGATREAACDASERELCYIKGASCEVTVSRTCQSLATCRWVDVRDETGCALTSLGRWWTSTSDVADNYPGLVLEGRAGACTRFMPAVRCDVEYRAVCAPYGASCDRVRGLTGMESNVCRWTSARSEAVCAEAASGIWTTADSTFAMNNRGTVAPGASGACATQLRNLFPE